jgi:hypothetical protein
MLQLVEFGHFLAIDKDDEYPDQNDTDQNRKNENNDPGLSFKELIGVEIIFPHHRSEPCTGLYIPVDIQKK